MQAINIDETNKKVKKYFLLGNTSDNKLETPSSTITMHTWIKIILFVEVLYSCQQSNKTTNFSNSLSFKRNSIQWLNKWTIIGPFSYDTTQQSAKEAFYNNCKIRIKTDTHSVLKRTGIPDESGSSSLLGKVSILEKYS